LGRLGNNLSGQYKRGVGMAVHIGIGNFGGAIASNIYRSQDVPRYVLGCEYTFTVHLLHTAISYTCTTDGLELMFVGIGFIAVPTAVLLYKRINAQRELIVRKELESGKKKTYTNQELRELGDRAPDFRYIL
jgi:hypothetical protein